MSDELEMTVVNYIEITMFDGLSNMECEMLGADIEELKIEFTINKQGRILTFDVDTDEQLHDILHAMGNYGLVEDIGLIKIVTSLEPQWEREFDTAIYH